MPTNAQFSELKEEFSKLSSLVMNLAENLKPQEKVEIKEAIIEKIDEEEKWINQELGGLSEPILSEYRGAVDIYLNKSFGIHIKSEAGRFAFTVLVPKLYSTMSPNQWAMLHFDKRIKFIDNVEGINGVKLFVESVFNSFSPEYQAMIVSDRLKNP